MKIQCQVNAQDFTKICIKQGEREKWIDKEFIVNWDELVFTSLRNIKEVDLTEDGYKFWSRIERRKNR